MKPMFENIAIIGIGLIGSSIALKAKKENLAAKISLYDIDESVRKRARELNLGEVFDDYQGFIPKADLIILCVPCGAMEAAAKNFAHLIKKGAILSDVGGVKAEVSNLLSKLISEDVFLIPAHPIAGTEYSGPDSGFASLFEGRFAIICPLEIQNSKYQAALQKVTQFWENLGSKVEIMNAPRHDMVLALTSHIPHLIAYCIVATAEDVENITDSEVVKFSAGGFRDFTRIAASDPTMWRDVFLMNKEAVLELLGRFSEDLTALRRAIRWDDGNTLFETFTRARRMRKEVISAGQDVSKANFGR